MKRIIATPEGAGFANANPGFRTVLINVLSPATRAHERAAMAEWTWPELPAHLRSMPDARAMVRHWVRTDYQGSPAHPIYTP